MGGSEDNTHPTVGVFSSLGRS